MTDLAALIAEAEQYASQFQHSSPDLTPGEKQAAQAAHLTKWQAVTDRISRLFREDISYDHHTAAPRRR